MIKKIGTFFVALCLAFSSQAQFTPGEILGAAALNAALAAPTITGGTINGAVIGATNPKAANFSAIGAVGVVSGTVSILPQSAAGTYNFNLPITAGASGSVLTSSGGGNTAMTWTPQSSITAGGLVASATLNTTTLVNPTLTRPTITGQSLTSTSTVTWDMASGTMATLTLTNSATISTPSNIPTSGNAALKIVQGSAGSYTLTWSSPFKWAAGVTPTLSTAVGAVDVISCTTFAGTALYCSSLINAQ